MQKFINWLKSFFSEKSLNWFLNKEMNKIDPNLLKGYWLFNTDTKNIKVISDKNFLKELEVAGVKIFNEINIPPNRYAYIPYKTVEFIVDGSVNGHMALDRRTKTIYARRFNCKVI